MIDLRSTYLLSNDPITLDNFQLNTNKEVPREAVTRPKGNQYLECYMSLPEGCISY